MKIDYSEHRSNLLLTMIVLILLLFTISCQFEEPQNDPFVGTWVLTSIEHDGIIDTTDGQNFKGEMITLASGNWTYIETTDIYQLTSKGIWENNGAGYTLTLQPDNTTINATLFSGGRSLTYTNGRGTFLFNKK